MEYLLAWRMAVARDLLRRRDLGIAQVAERVGYGSASTFSTAFSRRVGQPPGSLRAHELKGGCCRGNTRGPLINDTTGTVTHPPR